MWMWPQIKLKPCISVVAVDMYPSFLGILSGTERWSMSYYGQITVSWPQKSPEGTRYWEQWWYKPDKYSREKGRTCCACNETVYLSFRLLGWSKTSRGWFCPECIHNIQEYTKFGGTAEKPALQRFD